MFNYLVSDSNEFNLLKSMNDKSKEYGLILSDLEINELISYKKEVLSSVGRIELDNSLIKNIIENFCDTGFITSDEYSEYLSELILIFYNLRNSVSDNVSDLSLILYMKELFVNECFGNLELLMDKCLNGEFYE